ncbi:MAG: CHAT domain-containing protein [Microscillaceae bacterium]|nr:CHAT domain-containing protein [Microscillaceae bacterium]
MKQSPPALRQNPAFAASIALLKGKYYAHHQQIALALAQFQKVLHLASEEVGPENLGENPSKNTFYRSHTLQLFSAQALLGKAALLAQYPRPEWAALQTPEQIKQLCRRADDCLNDLRGKLVKENDRIALGETASQLYALSAKIALERQDADEFFYFAERNKAQVLLQAVQAPQARNHAGLPDTLQRQESALRQAIFEAETALEHQADSLKAGTRSRLIEANRLYRAFREKVSQEYPKYFALQNENPLISLSEVQQKLAPGEALLSFTFLPNPEEIGSLWISRDEVQMTTLKEGGQILKNIRQLRSYLSLRGNPEEMAANIADKSYRLHSLLLAPWKEQLATIKRLLIIPEGELNRLPFELLQPNSPAFRDGDVPQYLLYQAEITYHASATLAFSPKPAYTTQGWLGMAPFGEESLVQVSIHEEDTRAGGNRPKAYLSPLDYSDDEIQEIARICTQSNIPVAVYAREAAHKKQFLEKMAGFRWIHLATHSWGNTQEGDFSGIAFYQPSETRIEDENILYARELYHLPLKADLVVLSSCESGLGEDAPGEGVLSLTRSFLYAGANHLLYTLQKVGDEATYALMKAFYAQLIEKKLSYAEALRQAKLQMIRENRPPHDWAPVVLLGR